MNDFLIYMVKVSCILSILTVCYHMFFRKFSFHSFNRVLLLLFIPISFGIPMIELNTISQHVADMDFSLTEQIPANGLAGISDASVKRQSMDLPEALFIIYCLVLILYVIKLLVAFYSTYRLKCESEKYCINEWYYYRHVKIKSVFSCFWWIFIPESFNIEQSKTIIDHEKAHARLGHTFDLVLTEVVLALLWFNPFVYFFRRSIRTVHEYQADASALNSSALRRSYLQLLADQVSMKSVPGLNSYFNCLTIKNRVEMITRNNTSIKRTFYYLLLVPVIIFMVLAFSNVPDTGNNAPSIKPISDDYEFRISSGYGMRKHPISGEMKFHYAIDLAAPRGTPVVATADGLVIKVEFKEQGKGYGRVVLIQHNEIYSTLYTQLSAFNVKLNQKVKQGDIVGYVGESGISTAPHLHYEVWKNGERVNPENYFE